MSDVEDCKRAKTSSCEVVQHTAQETSILDLPEELLHKVLGGATIRIERWTELSLVCRAWQATMQSLVPVEVFISDKQHLKALHNHGLTIGGIVVKDDAFAAAPVKAASLLQYLGGKRCDRTALQSLVVRPRSFFTHWPNTRSCLQKLACLKRLDLRMDVEDLPQLCLAVAPGLLHLSLGLYSRSFPETAALQDLAQLTSLQELSVRVPSSRYASRGSVSAHRKALKPIFKAAQTLLGMEGTPGWFQPSAKKAGKSDSEAASKAAKLRSSQTSKRVDRQAGGDCDCGSRNEGRQSKATRCTAGYDPRIAKIQELVGEVCRRAEIAKTPRCMLGEVDHINIMLQGLQWQLALAMVMDTDESCRGPTMVKQLQDIWRAADIGPSWLDLRGMERLKSLVLDGVFAAWVPHSLRHLKVDSQGYVGPLPPGLQSYSAKFTASSCLTHWDLRPLGFLPLKSLAMAIQSSEVRHSREFCFQILQGTHSLQLHGQLEVMSLKTDRGLHVDAQMCHRLLSFLAQKKRLREVQVCSGYYSLQSIQGDSHQGRGVAALNLLSDLKDQCGWTVEQPSQRKDLPSTGPQVTTCRPPADWPFDLPDEEPDFVSDFE